MCCGGVLLRNVGVVMSTDGEVGLVGETVASDWERTTNLTNYTLDVRPKAKRL